MPEEPPDRAWHAFTNGLLHTPTLRFYPYASNVDMPRVVPCKRHDVAFDVALVEQPLSAELERAQHAQNAAVDRLVAACVPTHLRENAAVRLWAFKMLGRLAYENEH